MLQENKRIYAIMVCFIGGVKMAMEGIIFDEYLNVIIFQQFIYERCMVILFNFIAICTLFSIVRDEVGERRRSEKNLSAIQDNNTNSALQISNTAISGESSK